MDFLEPASLCQCGSEDSLELGAAAATRRSAAPEPLGLDQRLDRRLELLVRVEASIVDGDNRPVEAAAAPRLTELSHGAGCACKIGPGELGDIVAALPRSSDPALLVGAETRDDAGVFQVTDELAIVQTVDFFTPIVDDPYDFGRVAAANALSDVYAMERAP